MSVVNIASCAPENRDVTGALLSRSVAGCDVFCYVYSDLTNQVPATWFACDAGIRRLASLSDGPARGRRRFFTLCVDGSSDPLCLRARGVGQFRGPTQRASRIA